MSEPISPISIQIAYLSRQQLLADCTKALLILIKNSVESLPDDSKNSISSLCCTTYISVKNREEWASIRSSLPRAKWDREVNADEKTIRYIYHFGMVNLNITVGELPPSCKVIEEEVLIPEEIVPARMEKKRRIVCNEEKKDVDDLFVESPSFISAPSTSNIPF